MKQLLTAPKTHRGRYQNKKGKPEKNARTNLLVRQAQLDAFETIPLEKSLVNRHGNRM